MRSTDVSPRCSPKEAVRAVVRRMQRDPWYSLGLLTILDKPGRLVRFVPNPGQVRAITPLINGDDVFDLKARQVGCSTANLAVGFLRALLTPGYRVGILAHTHEVAEELFAIVKRYYDNLPVLLRQAFPVDTKNLRELKFRHGGKLKVSSAGSESFRGSTYNLLILSEFAHYGNVESMVASAQKTLVPGGQSVYETTALGPNHAYDVWHDLHSGRTNVFLSFRDDPTCVLPEEPACGVAPEIQELADRRGWTQEQTWWAAHAYRVGSMSNMDIFKQEHPDIPLDAFVMSGKHFFQRVYPGVEPFVGYLQLVPPRPYRVYTLGVDPAGGEPDGDFSCFYVLDVTDRQFPQICSTLYNRLKPSDFALSVLAEYHKYHPLVVIDMTGGYGGVVLTTLQQAEVDDIYMRTTLDKTGKQHMQKMGFKINETNRPSLLSRLQQYLNNGWIDVSSDRTLQHEATHFQWIDGKPQAAPGRHDDAILGLALGLEGMTQVGDVERRSMRTKPATHEEAIMFQLRTGKNPNDVNWTDGSSWPENEIDRPGIDLDDLLSGTHW